MELICACASDNGKDFIDRHFGESKYYFIYKINEDGIYFIRKIPNTSVEEKTHADPKKAKSVSSILKSENVQIVISRRFGPNIKRIKVHFTPVIVKNENMENGLKIVFDNFDHFENEVCKRVNQTV